MANIYNQSGSDMEPPSNLGDSADKRAKLMSVTAQENPDNVNSNNKLEQYKSSKTSGAFGTLGKRGVGDY